ncbi:MAG TPA: GH92 family glycosyl hydrolase, partial [Rugosimonospora sp.]|nr:GH92 family glycosyl hydrolase [Rugosimonospora sp.]
QQAVFYTALYHSLQHPSLISDTNRQYLGYDGQTHTVDSGHAGAYATFSGWDVYRAQAQLAAMIDPVVASDTAQSMVDDFTQTGRFPKWSLYNGETYVMVGDPADSILADYYAFGARNFDTATALTDMVKEASVANNIRPGLNYLNSLGYLPDDGSYGCCNFYGSVSTQLEYDTADYAIASFANALGDAATYTKYATRAQDWINVLNPASGLMQPRTANGNWENGFDPTSSTGFVEGDSWQYTGMVPFNLRGLAVAMGGNDKLRSYLDITLSDLRGQNGHADLGNEPSLELPWEYDYTGEPYQTQKVVREAQDRIWSDTAGGLAGNDDLGTMSSWYVWSALGMFPETPGTANLALGSPVFTQAQISLATGNTLTITGNGAADNAPYVQDLTVNGNIWNNAYAPSTLLSSGGTMTYTLGTAPNTSWATDTTAAPPSDGTGEPAVTTYATPGGSGLVIAPGANGTATLHAINMSSSTQSFSWKATTTPGITLNPSSGSLTVAGESTANTALTVTAGTAEGVFPVVIGSATLTVSVARPGELWPYWNNSGVGHEGSGNAANFDHGGHDYSAGALRDAGVTPGATVVAGGITYTFPNESVNAPDNVEANGQIVPVNEPSGATRIGVLGASSNAGPGATGTLTLTYTDGTTSQSIVGLSDWTLAGGSGQPISGNTTAVTMNRRTDVNGSVDTVGTYLFSVTAPITSGKTLASVTLPSITGGGTAHVFAVGYDVASASPVSITNPGDQSGYVGSAADLKLPASGSTLTYSATGLPAGLTLDTGTGEITGKPTTSGTYTVRATAADASGHAASTAFVWTISPGAITGVGGQCIDDPSQSTTRGTQVQIYDCNQTRAQQWTVEADGTLTVLGLCLTASQGEAVIADCAGASSQVWQPQNDGTLSNLGTGACLEDPGAGGSATRLLVATCTGTPQQQWQLPGGPALIQVTNPGDQNTVKGAAVSRQINAHGGSLSYAASGLPAGLGINANTGLITGTPTAAVVASVTVTATDSSSGATGHTSFTWTVNVASGAIVGVGGSCVDDANSSTADGATIQMWICDQTGAQAWTEGPDGTLRALGKCLTALNRAVVLETCTAAATQVWQLQPDATIRNSGAVACLTDPGSGGWGTALTVVTCDSSAADQRWTYPS